MNPVALKFDAIGVLANSGVAASKAFTFCCNFSVFRSCAFILEISGVREAFFPLLSMVFTAVLNKIDTNPAIQAATAIVFLYLLNMDTIGDCCMGTTLLDSMVPFSFSFTSMLCNDFLNLFC